MNWGKGLVIGLASFMIFITVLVVQMFRSAEDSFDKDYYEKGLAYDIDYNQQQQVITDKAQPVIQQTEDEVIIRFAGVDSGTVNFKRSSDRAKDRLFAFNQKNIRLPRTELENGEWRLVIKWTVDQKKYLYQTNLFLR